MIKRPDHISVGPRSYKVLIDPNLQLSEGLTGCCDHEKLQIVLLPRYFSSQLDGTLWHEVVHAISAVFLRSKLSEDDVNSLANGLTQVLSSIGIELEWEKEAIIKSE